MRIFTAVLNGQASSRRDLAQLLSIRSTSVSVLVGELLELRLLTETSASHSGRGRPLLTLVANPTAWQRWCARFPANLCM